MSDNIKKVKEILDITDTKLDKYLAFCEQVITDEILDRCNIDAIPERLNSLIQEFLIEQYKLNKDGILEGIKQVSSASDNGQTVNFEIIGGTKEIQKNAEKFIDDNMSRIVAYRKLRW